MLSWGMQCLWNGSRWGWSEENLRSFPAHYHVKHPSLSSVILSLSRPFDEEPWGMESERERQREISSHRQRVFSASSSQPCISTFDPNVDEERFGRDFKKSHRAGQRTGVTNKQWTFQRGRRLCWSTAALLKGGGGGGVTGHKTADIKIFLKFWCIEIDKLHQINFKNKIIIISTEQASKQACWKRGVAWVIIHQ